MPNFNPYDPIEAAAVGRTTLHKQDEPKADRFVVKAQRGLKGVPGYLIWDTETERPFAAVVPDPGPKKHPSTLWRRAKEVCREANEIDDKAKNMTPEEFAEEFQKLQASNEA